MNWIWRMRFKAFIQRSFAAVFFSQWAQHIKRIAARGNQVEPMCRNDPCQLNERQEEKRISFLNTTMRSDSPSWSVWFILQGKLLFFVTVDRRNPNSFSFLFLLTRKLLFTTQCCGKWILKKTWEHSHLINFFFEKYDSYTQKVLV